MQHVIRHAGHCADRRGGAGLAGLTCAWTLHRAGYDVVVLEARDRVGGRTWSATLPNGVVIERGGEWIDSDQHVIRRLCAELGLPLAPHGVRFHRRRVNDHVLDPRRAGADVARPSASTSPMTTPASRRRSRPPSARGTATIRPTCGSPRRPPGARPRPAPASTSRERRVRASTRPPGWSGATSGSRSPWPSSSATGSASVRRWSASRSTATGSRSAPSDAEPVAVDRAVVAVPLSMLDSIEWQPGFPEQWDEGLDRLETGTAVKLSVPTARRVRPDGVQHPTFAWWSWNSLDPAGDTGVPAVSCFAGGPAARDWLEVADGPATWIRHLDGAAPGPRAGRRRRAAHRLGDGPVDPRRLLLRARRPLPRRRRPAAAAGGALVLAGEHTAGPHSGTMEGAVASGLRAARSITG